MLQTLNPYTPTAKTAQIMARYRPIAPKPQSSNTTTGSGSGGGNGDEGSGSCGPASSPSSMSPTIRQSPYLRNVWPHLQSRPTRTRKRGRTSLGPPPPSQPPAFKRPRTLLQGLSPPFHITTSLPLVPSSPHHMQMQLQLQLQPNIVIDLNKEAAEVPEEKDLLVQLQKPSSNLVISPTPIRLIPSTVTIEAIKSDVSSSLTIMKKKSEEIERELETEALPAFVSDSKNQVRLVNSTYKNMVGQPECGWVESMVTSEVACKSICGKVVLNFIEEDVSRVGSSGFSCWVRIEWEMNGKKMLVNAFGEAIRVECESKDYKLAWRFHTSSQELAAAPVAIAL
ncbi:hypothetical protein QVD17_41083 [Tagetes erecta]|uniref:DUF7950 domain-containing protein n=1 Tax=Tagetes erecta TaxID=13708 RepID=A0AAD8JQS0_TARER|nr:hypothetical protein QVD17_41083 [Tagetes erecta]